MDITVACRDLNELNPVVKNLALKLIDECKKQGINMGISETYRSPERQDYLYAQGRTRPGKIITNVRGSSMSSYHQWRLAFDVYNNVRGAEYDNTVINRIGKIGQSIGLEWGGSWSGFRDTPHFQYTFGLSIAKLNAGQKPPNSGANTQENTTTVDKEYEDAIKKLVEKKIITDESAWLPNPNIKYVEMLIDRMIGTLADKKSYDEKIKVLQEKNIIGLPDIWLGKNYDISDVRWLIKKSAKLL